MKKNILIIGASGILGSNIIFYLKNKFKIFYNFNQTKFFFDNIKYTNVFTAKNNFNEYYAKQFLIKNNIEILINCAANADIDFCEKNPKKTFGEIFN